jgi:HK97 family phage major capsid protein
VSLPRVNIGQPGNGPTTSAAGSREARKAGIYNPQAQGATIDNLFNGAGEYFHAIWHGNNNRTAEVQNKVRQVKNAFSSDVPSEGGFLIPEVLRSELLTVALETAIVRPRARVIPMDSLRVPFPAVDSTTNVSSVFGGIIAYWTQEAAALQDTSAKFSQIVLDANKLTAYTEVPNELIADSIISFEAYINQIFPEALAFYEDYAFLKGSGVGEPKGVLNSNAMVSVAAEAAQPTATIVWENIVKAYARMLPGSLNRAVWIVSPDTFPELATMALSVGTGGSAVWLPNGVGAPTMTILGRPVIVSEKASVLGTAGDIAFVDLGFYLIGDRQTMSATSSMHFKFQNDVTAFRIIERVDGRPWLESAITPKNGGSALSPFVQLATRP